MVKISALDPVTPTTTDSIPAYDPESLSTKRFLLSAIITLFFNNVPSGVIPGSVFDYVISGGVWSGDSYGVNRNASMTALSVYINSRTIAIGAVTSRTFTASKDTYIDVLDNLDGTGTLVYTEVANNAASPALAANSIRIGIIVTGATTIAAVGSVNQGEETKILPIASSIAYTVTDSLGNLICPRDPGRRILGYRQITSTFGTATSGSMVDVTGLSCPVIVPAGRKIRITVFGAGMDSSHAAASTMTIAARESSTTLLDATVQTAVTQYRLPAHVTGLLTPSAGSHTYLASVQQSGTGTINLRATSTGPASILVELA